MEFSKDKDFFVRNIVRTRKLVKYQDVQIEVIIEGEGPLVVMLPSLGRGSEGDFDKVAEGIAKHGFRVLRPQPRGMGKSHGPMDQFNLNDYVQDVKAVIESQESGAAIIIGHAFGSWIARKIAFYYPHIVRGIVFASVACNEYPKELNDYILKSSDDLIPVSERLKYLKLAFFSPVNNPSIWLKGWDKDVKEKQFQVVYATRKEEWWSAGNVPILDLQASEDPFRPRSTENEIRDELGNRVTIVIIANASHALIPEQPQKVVDAFVNWYESFILSSS